MMENSFKNNVIKLISLLNTEIDVMLTYRKNDFLKHITCLQYVYYEYKLELVLVRSRCVDGVHNYLFHSITAYYPA